MICVYVSNSESNDISVFSLDPKSGDLSAIDIVPIPDTKVGSSSPLAASPDKRFLFVGNRGEPYSVATFAIDPKSGKLTYRSKGPLADQMAYLVTDRSGRYLLGASYGGNKVSVNPIGPDGSVGPVQQIVETPPSAHSILTDAANRYAFAASLGGNVVNLYRFDAASGQLSPNDPATVGVREKAGPRHFRFHPNNRFVYLLNELDGSLTVFDYDAARGHWGEKQTASVLPPGFGGKPWASDLHVTPDGKFLYGAERTTSTLAGFRIDSQTGTLTHVGNWPTETQPRGFAIDPAGRYLLAVGQTSHRLSGYAIEPDGGLRKLKDHPVGQNPNWVEILDLS